MPLDKVAAVVAGLAFVFFLLALIGSGLLETISGLFSWRATYLRAATDVLLGAAPRFTWGGPAGWFRAHFTRGAGPEMRVADPGLAPFVARVRRDPLVRGPLGTPPAYVPSRAFATAILLALGEGRLPATLEEARALAAGVPGRAGAALASLAAGADTLPAFRAGVAAWYEDAMREASAIYKCSVQRALLAIAALLTLGFDIDSLHLAREIWGAPLPFGWGHGVSLGTVPGWCLTVVATSMGAPFWFDLLQSVADLRSSGEPPRKEGQGSALDPLGS